ncbi:CPBP family intramembrane glutamic endopeptidase [Halostreptopolyspora alba]
MARTWRYRWWGPLLAVGCAVALIFLVQVALEIAALLVALISGFEPDLQNGSIFGAPVPDLAFSVIVLSTMTPLVMFVVRVVQWRRVGTLMSVEGRLRWRWMFACAASGVIPLVLSFAVLYVLQWLTGGVSGGITSGTPGGEQGYALAVGLILLFVPLQSSAEEIALRGFLMQAVGSYGAHAWERGGGGRLARVLRTPLPAIVISGGVFAILHDYTGWAMVDTAVFGIAMAWLSWYTGGLEAAIGLHVLHNLVVFSLSAAEGTLDGAASGGGSWQGLAATTLEVVLYAAFVAWLARRVGVRRRVPDEAADHERPGTVPTMPAEVASSSPGTTGRHPYFAPGHDPRYYGQAAYQEDPRQRYERGHPAPGGWVYPPSGGPHHPPHW